MPLEIGAPFICMPKMHVAMGPVTAEASVGASQMRGFLIMFGTCSMEVPMPCAKKPPQPLSRKLMTAKPIICAQQPATAAPPARPVKPSAAQMAALEIGSVNATPTMTETRMPMRNGCWVVAHMIRLPTLEAAVPMYGANKYARPQPEKMVTSGVTMMSTFVFLLTSLPSSAATMASTSTARGPPAPPSVFAAPPTATSENSTSGGACSA